MGLRRRLGRPLRLVCALMACCLAGATLSAAASEQTSTQRSIPGEAAKPQVSPQEIRPQDVIPLEQVAPRAAEVASLLRAGATDVTPDPEVEAIRRSLPAVSAASVEALQTTERLLAERPSLETLQTLEQAWLERQSRTSAWLKLLTDRAAGLQAALDRLDDLHGLWTRTRDSGQMEQAPAPIVAQIDATLASIQAAAPPVRMERDATLDLQGQVAAAVIRGETARAHIARAQQTTVTGILARDGLPVWAPSVWSHALAILPARLAAIGASYHEGVLAYSRDPSKRLPVHLVLLLLTVTALFAARGQVEQWTAAGQDVRRLTVVFDRPWAAALLLALYTATTYTSPAPFTVKQVLGVVALVPMIIIARSLVPAAVVTLLYVLGLLFALDTVRHAFGGIPSLVDQLIIFVESLTGVLVLGRLAWCIETAGPSPGEARSHPRRLWRLLSWSVLLVFAIGLASSTLGYLRVARLTTPAVLIGAVDALWLYTAVEVGMAVIAYALRVWPLRHLRMIRHHPQLIEARLHRWIIWLAIGGWLFRYLNYLGLWEPSVALLRDVLTSRVGLGSFSTSVADLLAFLATILVGYLVSSFLRFVLEEDVYPRIGMPLGISYAASSLLHYVIVAVTFLLALGLLGVTLTQVTVLAGALGVGIGFGLQSIVNNFVSGLILLFERPIHVGDAVQVGELTGRVRRIGIRASVVRTVEGAEIIVPNAQLTTQQVTNWTLSDQQRRIDLPIGLGYGSAPAEVIELLEGVARHHPKVLSDPPPCCLFVGYGDSTINFELRAWTDYATATQVKSDLTVAVYEAVYAAGLSFPFPQREVRLLSDPSDQPGGTRPPPGPPHA